LRAEADELAGLLLGEGLSVRDVAALVGLTPGRISQIAPVQAGEKRDERASTASLPRVRTPHRHGDGDSPSSPAPTSFKSGDVSAT